MAYINTSYYELREDVTLNTTDFPTTALVTEWITQAEDEINDDLGRIFDYAVYTDTITPNRNKLPTRTLFAKNTPIDSGETLTVQYDANRDNFNPNMTTVDSVIIDSGTGMIETREATCQQKVTIQYTGGYNVIPSEVQYLTYLIVKRIQTDIEIRQEIGDDTTTSISSITVRERTPASLTNKLQRLDEQIKELKEKLGGMFFVGVY